MLKRALILSKQQFSKSRRDNILLTVCKRSAAYGYKGNITSPAPHGAVQNVVPAGLGVCGILYP
jgi:hypothetical protein